MAREGKLSDGKKVQMVMSLYSDLERLYNSPDTKIEDFERFNSKIIEYMNNEILSKAEGEKIINTFSLSYMAKMESEYEQYGANNFITADEGFQALGNWIKDVLGKEPKKGDYNKTAEQRAQYETLMGARARNVVAIYKLYADALSTVAKEKGLSSVSDIINMDNDIEKKAIYGAAVELTKATWAKSQYKSLENTNINPTAILSGRDGLVNISDSQNESNSGINLQEKRISKLLYDKENGKYGLKYEDGEIREISREAYKRLGGRN